MFFRPIYFQNKIQTYSLKTAKIIHIHFLICSITSYQHSTRNYTITINLETKIENVENSTFSTKIYCRKPESNKTPIRQIRIERSVSVSEKISASVLHQIYQKTRRINHAKL